MSELRYEMKFVLNELEYKEVFMFLKRFSFFKPYTKRYINSLYFDTLDFKSVKDNISGVAFRDKVRLRWYDDSKSLPVLEKKNKIGRAGFKYRINTCFKTIEELNTLTSKQICNNIFKNKNINKFSGLITQTNFFPILLVKYKRKYYKSNKNIRITIDSKIQFSHVTLNKPLAFQKKISYNRIVMEIKFPLEKKDHVNDLIRQLRLTPTRHSKYLVGVSKLGYAKYI